MKYKISYCYEGTTEGTTQLLTKVMEAVDEKAVRTIFQDVYGSNRACTIYNIIPQPDVGSTDNLIKPSEKEKRKEALFYFAVSNESFSQKSEEKGSAMSKELSGSNAALASASEAADKLTAYKARQSPKEQEHIWFYTVDGENILGPVVFASIQNKIDKGILKENSLVMRTGGDWMTVSEFKITGSSIADAKPSSSFSQSYNANALPVKATPSSPHSTQTAYEPSPYSKDRIYFAQQTKKAGSTLVEAPNKYPSLFVSFWFIYVLGFFLISLIGGPLSSVFSNHHSDILERLTAKVKIMALIDFLYLLIAAFMVYLSSSEYRAQMFQWHYFARGIVFLHILLVSNLLFNAFLY
ncbi:hypothetical protein OAD18_11075 [Oceanospirillaceae bacterium]|nr:hypothetical protein [Oceanospirillaceae bacterium]